jgi:hypothetical protein
MNFADWHLGALLAAGITYKTADIVSTWSWRIPSLVQGFFSLMCILLLPFLPESPRWLIFQDRGSEALTVLAQVISDGDEQDPAVTVEFHVITQTIAIEKGAGKQLTFKEMFRSRSARWRLSLVVSSALATVVVGEYLDTRLTSRTCHTDKPRRQPNRQLVRQTNVNSTNPLQP